MLIPVGEDIEIIESCPVTYLGDWVLYTYKFTLQENYGSLSGAPINFKGVVLPYKYLLSFKKDILDNSYRVIYHNDYHSWSGYSLLNLINYKVDEEFKNDDDLVINLSVSDSKKFDIETSLGYYGIKDAFKESSEVYDTVEFYKYIDWNTIMQYLEIKKPML